MCCDCGWQSDDIKLSTRHIHLLHKVLNPDCVQSKNVLEQFDQYTSCKATVIDIESLLRHA